MSETLAASATAFIAGCDDSEFRPFAYYDKHLDCIRVQLMDCSFKEERRNRIVTVLTANHMENNSFVGFEHQRHSVSARTDGLTGERRLQAS